MATAKLTMPPSNAPSISRPSHCRYVVRNPCGVSVLPQSTQRAITINHRISAGDVGTARLTRLTLRF
jgi:hypothetical protein